MAAVCRALCRNQRVLSSRWITLHFARSAPGFAALAVRDSQWVGTTVLRLVCQCILAADVEKDALF